jgi:ankyrin repeat protein
MYGYTALHYAIEEGDFELVKFLLDHNANPNIQDANGVTPYNLARSYAGLEPIVELLLQKGADPKIKDKFGKTYLM